MKSTLDRFMSKVFKDDSGCWEWQAAKTSEGYGQFYFNGCMMGAHRVSYWIMRSPVPDGLQIDHLCRNKSCVNPDHLEMVTQRENILRGETSVVALNARKTHCKRGHAFTEENTILNKIGSRNCRICIRDWDSRIEQKEKRRLWAIEYHKTDRWKEYRKQYYASKKKV